MTANEITALALKELDKRDCEVWRQNQLRVKGRKFRGRLGLSDIQGFQRNTGLAVYCEVKAGEDSLSDDQIDFLNKAQRAGCVCLVATNYGKQLLIYEYNKLDLIKFQVAFR